MSKKVFPFSMVLSRIPDETVPGLTKELSDFHRWKNGKYQFLDLNTYDEWVASGQIRPADKYDRVEQGFSVLVCIPEYATSDDEMGGLLKGVHEQMMLSIEFFLKGWRLSREALKVRDVFDLHDPEDQGYYTRAERSQEFMTKKLVAHDVDFMIEQEYGKKGIFTIVYKDEAAARDGRALLLDKHECKLCTPVFDEFSYLFPERTRSKYLKLVRDQAERNGISLNSNWAAYDLSRLDALSHLGESEIAELVEALRNEPPGKARKTKPRRVRTTPTTEG